MGTLSLSQLAEEADVAAVFLEELVRVGVLRPGADGEFGRGDLIRIEAVRSFLEAGVPLEVIARGLEEGLFTFEYLDRFHPEPARRSSVSLAALADELGVERSTMIAVYLAMGLPEPGQDTALREDEEDLLRRFVDVWGPADEDALVRAARLVGEPARILSEGWTRLYVEKVSDPMSEEEISMDERIRRIVATTEKATALAPSLFMWLMQRHLRRAIDRANFEGLEESMTARDLGFPVRERLPAVAFVDVSGYTAMTERLGDVGAVGTASVLRDRATAISHRHEGRVVKLLGDGAMLLFPEAGNALAAVTELMAALADADLVAHAGINAGPLIEHDGDVFGRTVNLAARVADRAEAGQVLVTATVAEAAPSGRFRYLRLPPLELKGIADPVEVYSLVNEVA